MTSFYSMSKLCNHFSDEVREVDCNLCNLCETFNQKLKSPDLWIIICYYQNCIWGYRKFLHVCDTYLKTLIFNLISDMYCFFVCLADREVQRILLELLNQMDGFDQNVNVKVQYR